MANTSVSACEAGRWHLHLWDRRAPHESSIHVPWNCRSWRHEGKCREWKGSQDFQRVAEAIQSGGYWTFLTLTFAQNDWPDKWALYRAGFGIWSRLRKRITREFGKFRYIQTWERHQKGGTHCHMVVDNERIFHEVAHNERALHYDWFMPHALAAGFGYKLWIKRLYDADGIASYLTKVSRELTGSGHKSQVPVDAPPHFRRIRASRKTLPPPLKSDLTGRLVFCTLQAWERLTPIQRVHEVESIRQTRETVNAGIKCDP